MGLVYADLEIINTIDIALAKKKYYWRRRN